MPLKVLSFKGVHFLTEKHIMKIVKLFKSSELALKFDSTNDGVVKFAKVIKSTQLVIKIKKCCQVKPQGLKNVLNYIEENNLSIKIKHDKVLA